MSDIKNITPQGPSGYPLIGNLLNLASSQRLAWLQSLTDKYGDVSKFKIRYTYTYVVYTGRN